MNDRDYYYPETATERLFNFLSAAFTIVVMIGLGAITIGLVALSCILF